MITGLQRQELERMAAEDPFLEAVCQHVAALESELAEAEAERARLASDAGVTQAMALRRELAEALADVAKLLEHIDTERQHDLQLRLDLGATESETLRGAVLRVKKERDEACAQSGEWRRGSWVAYHEHKALQSQLDAARAEAGRLQQARSVAEEEVERLRAELARLKPSGQVAGDVKVVEKVMGASSYDAPYGDGMAALSRLAALAQRTQDAEARVDRLGNARDSWKAAHEKAESQLRASRERAKDEGRQTEVLQENVGLGGNAGLMAVVRWVVDGDAENPPKAEAWPKDEPTPEETTAHREGYDAGAEAMRAAYWEAVLKELHRYGMHAAVKDFKAAIEGAAP